MVQMGKLTQAKADAMTFPAPSPHVPRTVGKDVWDPYVLNMVEGELGDVYKLTKSQIYNGGYVIRTSIDDTKMATLYKAVADNMAQIDASSVPFNPVTMHAGAVLEDPLTGAIEALYPGPGYAGSKYDGTGKIISAKYCYKIHCQLNMALTREQVGSSFKPYILATAVKDGMNIKTSASTATTTCTSRLTARRWSTRQPPFRPFASSSLPVGNNSASNWPSPRRRSQSAPRSTPPTPTSGTGWPDPAARTC